MRFCCLFLLFAAVCIYSQVTPNSTTSSISQGSPDRVIATVNGEKFTQRDFDRLLAAMTPEVRKQALEQPREVLEQYATFQVLLADAEKAKLAERSPYREQLAEARRQFLIQAQLGEISNEVDASPEALRKNFDDHKSRYTEAKVKVIFISLVSNDKTLDGKDLGKREAIESKKLAEEVFAKLKAGADFAETAKKYSDDGSTATTGADYPDTISGTSAGMPENMRESILASKQGDLVGPFEHATGFYIFRVESLKRKSFEEASKDMLDELRRSRVQEKISEARKRATVDMPSPGVTK